jgi:hypothetical protein
MRDMQRKTTDQTAGTTAAASVNRMAVTASTEAAGAGVVTTTTGELPEVLRNGGLTLALFGHPLLRSLQSSRVGLLGATHRNPSYLASKTFARVLIDTLVPDDQGSTTLIAVRATVEKLPDGLPAKKSLLTLLRRSGNDAFIREVRSPDDWRLRILLRTGRRLIPERRIWPVVEQPDAASWQEDPPDAPF